MITEGVEILGVPFGSSEYCNTVYTEVVADIRNDLTLIESIEPLHIRAKLLTYCVNTRFDYFLSTDSLVRTLPFAEEVDTSVASALCQMLHWPTVPGDSTLALAQLRLPISRGGWGVRSLAHSAPAAILGTHLSFFKWLVSYDDHLTSCDVLRSAIASKPFLRSSYLSASSFLNTKYSIPVSTVLPDPVPPQSLSPIPFFAIPAYQVLDHWPGFQFPSRQQIFAQIGNFCYQNLLQTLSTQQASRLRALAKLTYSRTRCPFVSGLH